MEQNYIESLGAIASPVDIRDYRLTATKTQFPEEFELSMP